MRVEAIALTSFTHDDIRAVEGRTIVPWLDESLANEFERAGLVRIKMAAIVPRVVTPPNAQAGGEAQRSAASLPAPASNSTTTRTAQSSAPGHSTHRKRGR